MICIFFLRECFLKLLIPNSVSASNGVLMIVSRAFYIEHRMAVGYARLSLEEKIPTFESLPQWKEKMSTKMDTCARICQHLLSRDDAPEPLIVDGQLVLPPLPDLPEGEEPQQTVKIIISQEFPSLSPLLRNVSVFVLYFRRRFSHFAGLGTVRTP